MPLTKQIEDLFSELNANPSPTYSQLKEENQEMLKQTRIGLMATV
jgi:hypothetical protein